MLHNVQGNTAYLWRQLILFVYVPVFGFPRSGGNNTHRLDWICCRGSLRVPHIQITAEQKRCACPHWVHAHTASLTHCWGHGQGGNSRGKRKGSSDHHSDTGPPTSDHSVCGFFTSPVCYARIGGGKRTHLSTVYLLLGTDKKLCILEKRSTFL